MSIGKTTNPIATKYAGKSRQKSPETDVILGDGIRKSLRPIVPEKKYSKMEMEGYVFIYRYEMANLGYLHLFQELRWFFGKIKVFS